MVIGGFLNFIELKDKYNSYNQHKSCFNGSLGKIYNLKYNNVNNLSCNMWECPRCRPYKKHQLFLEIYYLTQQLKMDKHFIMTFQGEEFRKRIPYYKSYKIMSKIWNKYKKVIEYHKGKFDYIILPRAQQDGYCHFHTIIPKYISWKFLDEKRKLYPEMGYVRINKNVDLAQYLHKDFFKDNEYVIPGAVRHYSTSRGLKLNKYKNPYFREDNVLIMGKHSIQDLEDLVLNQFGRALPVEYYIKELYK